MRSISINIISFRVYWWKRHCYYVSLCWPREREDGGSLSVPLSLIILDTTRCFYKVSLSLTVLIPLSSKTAKVKLNPERRILNGKIRGQICLNHHLLLIRKSMAFDARVHVCLLELRVWKWQCGLENWPFKQLLSLCCLEPPFFNAVKSPLSHNVCLSKKLLFLSLLCETLLKKSFAA